MARRRRPPRAGALTELPPLKIASQILALQAIYYTTAFALFLFSSLVSGTKFSLSLLFSWTPLRGDTTAGWLDGFIWCLVGGVVVPIAIALLVQRSKLVPDFALSLHAIHLLIVSLYSGSLPRHLAWWAAMVLSSGLSVALGVWGCRWRELRPITFGGTVKQNGSAGGGDNGEGSSAGGGGGEGGVGDEEQGFTRGRGRGRGRDGGGEYEMVEMGGEGR